MIKKLILKFKCLLKKFINLWEKWIKLSKIRRFGGKIINKRDLIKNS